MVALVFVDGFDKYGPENNQNLAGVLNGDWAVGTNLPSVVTGLSALGYAFSLGTNLVTLTGALPTLSRVSGSVRFQLVSGTTSIGNIRFNNGSTTCCSILFQSVPGASIGIYTGLATTLIAQTGFLGIGATHVLSWDITIGASSAYTIYLDGVSILSGTGNTGNGLTSVNGIVLACATATQITYDDLAVFNPTDAAYNSAVITSNIVVETQFPTSDNQKQFTDDGNVVWPTGIEVNGVYSNTATVSAPAANSLFLVRVVPVVNSTINSVSVMPKAASAGANFRSCIYSDSSGAPGTLLSSGTQATGTTSGTVLTSALTTPQSLTAGTSYWIGFTNDTSVNLAQVDNITNHGVRAANTYTSGAPGTAPAMTTLQPTWQIWGNCTGGASNYASEMLNPPLGTVASQVHSATVAQEDLYGFPALVTPAASVFGSAVKGFVAKSDSGARTVSFNMKSGATDSTGSSSSQTLATTPQWQKTLYDGDPNTGSAWTVANLNAAVSGISVAS